MPRYMLHGTYTASGAAGLMKEGGTSRRAAVDAVAKSVGGSIESMDWAFGAEDFYIIANVPDAETAAALSLTVGATGAVRVTTSELLSAAQVDEVVRRRVDYRPPGA